MADDTGCERISKENVQRVKFFIHSPGEERGLVWRHTPPVKYGGFELLLGEWGGSKAGWFRWSCVGLQLVLVLSLGAGSSPCGLVCPVSGASAPQGTSSNFLGLRIEAHKTRVSPALWGPASAGKRARKGGFCPINMGEGQGNCHRSSQLVALKQVTLKGSLGCICPRSAKTASRK